MAISQEHIETITKDIDKQFDGLASYLGVAREDLGNSETTHTVHQLNPHLDLEISYKINLVKKKAGATVFANKDAAVAGLNNSASKYSEADWHNAPSFKFLKKTEPFEDPEFQSATVNYKHDCPDCDAKGNYQCNNCNGHGRTRCSRCDNDGEVACHSCRHTGRQTCFSCGGSPMRNVWVSESQGGTIGGHSKLVTCSACSGLGTVGPCYTCRGRKYVTCGSCSGRKYFACHPCDQTGRIQCGRCNATGTAVSGLALVASLKTTPSFNVSHEDAALKYYLENRRLDFFSQPDITETRTGLEKLSPRKARATYSIEALTAEIKFEKKQKIGDQHHWTAYKPGRHKDASYGIFNQLLNWNLVSEKVTGHDFEALQKFPAGRDILENLMASTSERARTPSWARLHKVLGNNIDKPIEQLATHAEAQVRTGERWRASWLFVFVAFLGFLMHAGVAVNYAYEKLGPYGLSTLNQYTGLLAVSAALLVVFHIDRKRKRRLRRIEAFTGSGKSSMGRTPLRAWRTLATACFVFVAGSALIPALTATLKCGSDGAAAWAECAYTTTSAPYRFWKLGLQNGEHGDLALIWQMHALPPRPN